MMATAAVLPSVQEVSRARLRRRQSSRRAKRSQQDSQSTALLEDAPLPPDTELEGSVVGVARLLTRIESERLPPTQNLPNSDQEAPPLSSEVESRDQDTPPPVSEVLCVTVHGADRLRASVHVAHPVVRMSVVEGESGELLKKSSRGQCVASFYERDNPAVDFILPILTQPWSSNEQRLHPRWEESLILNERVEHFTQNENTLLFLEVLDFSAAPLPSWTSHAPATPTPWHRVAWAFLRLVGRGGSSNVGRRHRLQLYTFPRRPNPSTGASEVFHLWSHHHRTPYPSTLHVSVKAIAPPSPLLPAHRSMAPTQQEVGRVPFEQLLQQQKSKSVGALVGSATPTLSPWTRLPGQRCRVPLSPLSPLHPSSAGTSALAFSHNGRFLAVGCAESESYPVIVYEVPSFLPALHTPGHRGMVHALSWAPEDTSLASASADGLVRVWSMEKGGECVCVLPHPCYVYTVTFPSSSTLLTGGYDHCIRVWTIADSSAQLLHELRGVGGMVNCLQWSKSSRSVYCGDSRGRVGVWREEGGSWSLQRTIPVAQGPLLSLWPHPSGRKLLTQSPPSPPSLLDLRIDRVSVEYGGVGRCRGVRCGSVLSPCGGVVFAGDERGRVYAWDCDTGHDLHCYSSLPLTCPVVALAYHPSLHMMACAAFGPNQPLLVFVGEGGGREGRGRDLETSQRVEQASRTLFKVLQRPRGHSTHQNTIAQELV